MAEWFSSSAANSLSQTLLHFLWQGALIGLVYRVLRTASDYRPAHVRYLASLMTLLVMAVCPVVTFWVVDNTHVNDVAESMTLPFKASTAALAAAESDAVITGGARLVDVDVAALEAERHPYFVPMQSAIVAAQPYVLLVWLTGVTLLSVRLAGGLGGLIWLRSHQSAIPVALQRRSQTIAWRLGLQHVRIRSSARIAQAAVVGFLKPVVLLPASWLTVLPVEVLEAVIAHELAHIRRYDVWVNLFQRVVEAVLFYHPVVWWVSNQIRLEREMCCDDLAVQAIGDRGRYAVALEEVGKLQIQVGVYATPAFTGEGKMNLLRRIQNVLGTTRKPQRELGWPSGVLAGVMCLAIVLLFGSPTTRSAADDAAQDRVRAVDAAADQPEAATAVQAAASDPPKPQPIPESLMGFRGMLLGRLVTKDVERGEFTVTIDYVPRVWENNTSEQPRSAVGKTFLVDGVSGRFLDRLLLIEAGETLRFEAQQLRNDRLTFPGELLEKVAAYEAEDYPVPPDAFRGFRGIVTGTLVEKREDQLEMTLRIDAVERVFEGNGAEDVESGVGQTVVVAGFWQQAMRERYDGFSNGDTLRMGLQHRVTASDHMSVVEVAERVSREDRGERDGSEPREPVQVELDDNGFPVGMHGFRGILSGRLVDKDIEEGTLTFVADGVTRTWERNRATDLESCEGHTFVVEGISGRWLDVLITIEKEDRLEVEAFHNGGDHLDFVQEWLKKVE